MDGDVLGSFCTGTALGLSLGSPAEWAIHKYLLHASQSSRKIIPFIEGASRGHNDNHHGAYKAPEHYYRDVTNENEVIHFAKSDVGIIGGIAAFVGTVIERAQAIVTNNYQFGGSNVAFIAGVLSGTMMYYGSYELVHHQMHVLGKRRLTINRVLGDTIQGGQAHRDGNLRLSKPLLDDICATIERDIDAASPLETARESFILPNGKGGNSLSNRLEGQIRVNESDSSLRSHIEIAPADALDVLTTTYEHMKESEETNRSTLGVRERIGYFFERSLQRIVRASPLFKRLDNHHYLHHRKYGKNLNVVFPAMDYCMGTKEESSVAALEENRNYWLCPNSPDEQRFKRKVAPLLSSVSAL